VDTAIFAAEKCPRFRIVEESIFANVQDVGVSKEQVMGQEWKDAMLLGEANAKDGNAKKPGPLSVLLRDHRSRVPGACRPAPPQAWETYLTKVLGLV
jgi:hypothetical protein